MRAEPGALAIEDRALLGATRLGREVRGEPPAGVAIRDEADVVAVGLRGDREPALLGLGAHLGLRRGRAEREPRVRELLGGEHAEHVRLVFGPGRGTMQLDAIRALPHLGVVTCDDRVEAERERLVEEGRELYL